MLLILLILNVNISNIWLVVVLSSLIPLVNASQYTSNLILNISPDVAGKIYLGILLIGLFLYPVFQSIFDYISYKNRVLNTPVIKNKILNNLLSGLVYLLSIQCGILSTNCFWFLTNQYPDGSLWFLLSCIITIVFGGLWNSYQLLASKENPSFSLSVIRSLMDVLSFSGVAWSSYYSWSLIQGFNIGNESIIFAILGLILHIIFSVPTIYLEIKGTTGSGSLLYGCTYLLSFTFMAWSTNSIVNLLSSVILGPISLWLLLAVCAFFVVVFNPNIYRHFG